MGTKLVSIAPFFLRLALGTTLIWSSLGVLNTKVTVSSGQGAILAKMGVIPETGAVVPDPVQSPEVRPESPPLQAPVLKPVTPPEKLPPGKPAEAEPKEEQSEPKEEVVEPAEAPPAHMVSLAQLRLGTAVDGPAVVKRVDLNAVRMYEGAFPEARADGVMPPSIWPQAMAKEKRPVYGSWTVTILQLVGGVLILGGLFTRLGAFLGLMTTGVVVWLSLLGPAIQSGSATLGFLPTAGAWEVNAASEFVHGALLWGFLMICSCLSLLSLGGGAISLDAVLFPARVARRSEVAPA
jgi:uncharacterized membrane protein YphA (DoxX/SURF4 family)